MSALPLEQGDPQPGDLASRSPRIVTALPGPKARAMIDAAMPHLSPSLIHVYPLMVARAAGCMVEDVDGNVFLDAQAGVATASTGHCHPDVAAAMKAQVDTLVHICGTDFHYPGYGALCERLGAIATRLEQTVGVKTPGGWRTFLTNSGTEAVEAAMKLARYHTRRSHLIAFRGGFHGRSMGSLSLTASKSKYKRHFGPLLPGVLHGEYGSLASVHELFKRLVAPDDVAAIVLEPVLGEGGYLVPPAAFLTGLRQLCDQHGIMLVFDEVQSGMGRTGKMLAAEHFGVVPDIFVLAKGLASGMPLGAMMAKSDTMSWTPGTHGSTCGGNPVSIAGSLATLDLLESALVENAARVGARLMDRLKSDLAGLAGVEEVRGLGLMIGIEFRALATATAVAEACWKAGLLVLECGEKAIRLSPPLIITEAQADLAAALFTGVCRKLAAT